MPKHQFKVSAEAAKAEFDPDTRFYDGPTPPNGVYRGVLKKMWLKETTKAPTNPAIQSVFEIREPKDSAKAKYNNAGIFDWQNITDASAMYVNAWLSALGFGKNMDDVNKKGGIVTDDEGNIIKLGAKRITGELECRFSTKIDDQGRAKIGRVLPAQDEDDEDTEPEEDEAEGLSLDDGKAEEDESEAEAEGEEESGIYTEAELEELEPSDLKEIAAAYELDLTPKARKATIIAAILEAQEAAVAEGAEEEGEEAAEAEAEEDGDEAEAEESEAMSEEDLDELELPDLKEYADSIELEYPPKITKSKLVALILEFQDAPESTEDEAEESEDEEEAEAGDVYTEDDLMEMELSDLKEMLVGFEVEIPKPPIKRKLVTAILAAQAASNEPPF